jgi:hypothetical protein
MRLGRDVSVFFFREFADFVSAGARRRVCEMIGCAHKKAQKAQMNKTLKLTMTAKLFLCLFVAIQVN